MSAHVLAWHDTPPVDCRGGAVSVGNFDGVHRGHMALINELRRQAQAIAGPAVALTFDPHPLEALRPEQFLPQLTLLEDRIENLHAVGVDHVLVLRVTLELLQLRPAEFFDFILRERLAVRAVVEGTNFGFGRNREGDVKALTSLCQQHGIVASIVAPLLVDGVPVSSSRVRNCLTSGDVAAAADLLGRPYRLRGVVGMGQRRGRTLGFPTANLEAIRTVVPGNGVYAVRVQMGDASWPGAANVGPNPTFGELARKVEVHLIDFEGDLYRKPLALDFLARLRETRPFASAADLMKQLTEDVHAARCIAAGT
jgi:riboflavin kinase / FMN adenylyltransferase